MWFLKRLPGVPSPQAPASHKKKCLKKCFFWLSRQFFLRIERATWRIRLKKKKKGARGNNSPLEALLCLDKCPSVFLYASSTLGEVAEHLQGRNRKKKICRSRELGGLSGDGRFTGAFTISRQPILGLCRNRKIFEFCDPLVMLNALACPA